ncbi:MAG: alpha/beta hydrolase family protein, partial [Waterburya sp.]
MPDIEHLTLAGVPVVLRSPAKQNSKAPLILLWHGFGSPNSEEMLAEVLSLERVPAWKAYLGLPLFGQRLPEGGIEEIMNRQIDDYVLELLLPVAEQAMKELSKIVSALQNRYPIDRDVGIGL